MASGHKRVATGKDIQAAIEAASDTHENGVVEETLPDSDSTVEVFSSPSTQPFTPPPELMAKASGKKD